MYTHFIKEENHGFHVFNIETCEGCDCDCEAPNAITYCEPREKLISLGMREAKHRLPELYASNVDGLAYCETCLEEEEEEEEEK